MSHCISWSSLARNNGARASAQLKRWGARMIGEGVFRHVHSLGDAIIKVPRRYRPQPGDELWKSPLVHARKEITLITRIHHEPALKHLRRYTPRLIWADEASGIIVMPRFQHVRRREFNREELAIVQMFRDTLEMHTADYGRQNLMRDAQMTPIVVDLGY